MYMNEVGAAINGNKILQQHRSLLSKLYEDRVMIVGYEHDDTFYIQECCDDYFYHDLTENECIELSELFGEIAVALRKRCRINDCGDANG